MSVSATKSSNRGHRAGIFDIRNIIGALLGIDGVIILLVGIFGDAEEDKTGGVNANLWAGLVLVVMSAIFLVWAQLETGRRPRRLRGRRRRGPPGGSLTRARAHTAILSAKSLSREGIRAYGVRVELTTVSAIRGVAPHVVAEAVESYVDGAGLAPTPRTPGPAAAGIRVAGARDGWTTVTWPSYFAPQDLPACRWLSRELRTVVEHGDHDGSRGLVAHAVRLRHRAGPVPLLPRLPRLGRRGRRRPVPRLGGRLRARRPGVRRRRLRDPQALLPGHVRRPRAPRP